MGPSTSRRRQRRLTLGISREGGDKRRPELSTPLVNCPHSLGRRDTVGTCRCAGRMIGLARCTAPMSPPASQPTRPTLCSTPTVRARSVSGTPAANASSASARKRPWVNRSTSSSRATCAHGIGRAMTRPCAPAARATAPAICSRCRRIRKDGTRISVEFSIIPVRDTAGRMQGMGAILRDVTKRFEELKALRKAVAAR